MLRTPAPSSRVTTVPNESWLHGRVLDIRPDPTSFRGEGADWKLQVVAVEDVPGARNFARGRAGSVMDLFVPSLPPGVEVAVGDAIRARVSFQGDERSGRFVLVGDDLRKM
jgi:hypothetical protein